MDITIGKDESRLRVPILDARLKQLGGIDGISTTGDGVIVHHNNAAQEDNILDIVSLHGSIDMVANQTTIDADGQMEAVITCGLTDFNYRVWLNGAVILSGNINDGSLEFSTDDDGVFTIEVISGLRTGYIDITAIEV